MENRQICNSHTNTTVIDFLKQNLCPFCNQSLRKYNSSYASCQHCTSNKYSSHFHDDGAVYVYEGDYYYNKLYYSFNHCEIVSGRINNNVFYDIALPVQCFINFVRNGNIFDLSKHKIKMLEWRNK